MPGLPKSIIKRYGVTKKAWQVFRGARTTSSPSRKAPRGPMAKKRKSFSRSRGNSSQSPMNALIGGALSGAVIGVIPQQYNTQIVRAGLGYAACSYGSGMVKNAGFITLGAEAQRFTAPLAQGVVGGITGGSTTNNSQGW